MAKANVRVNRATNKTAAPQYLSASAIAERLIKLGIGEIVANGIAVTLTKAELTGDDEAVMARAAAKATKLQYEDAERVVLARTHKLETDVMCYGEEHLASLGGVIGAALGGYETSDQIAHGALDLLASELSILGFALEADGEPNVKLVRHTVEGMANRAKAALVMSDRIRRVRAEQHREQKSKTANDNAGGAA